MHTGGAERVAAHLVNVWAKSGDEVTLIATYSGRGDCHYGLDPRVNLIFLADLVNGKGKFGFWARLKALRSLIRTEKPTVVVSFLTNVNVMTLLATVGLSVPVVVSERTFPGRSDPGRALRVLRQLTYARATTVVMLASAGAKWLSQNIPAARSVVIPNPVPFPLTQGHPPVDVEGSIRKGRKVLLGAGRLDDTKQFDRLLASFDTLADAYPDWDLVIVGEGPDRAALEALIKQLGREDRVSMPGRVGNIGDWYARADIYVLSSRVEGFPNTLAEAMAHGCAAVSYDCETGPSDIIIDGVDGLLVRPVGDVKALAEAMAMLMRDSHLRERMRQQAVRVRERFSTAAVLDRWEELFREVVPSVTRESR
jgi:glycosyltransferase involved in cell wall biosynthesis